MKFSTLSPHCLLIYPIFYTIFFITWNKVAYLFIIICCVIDSFTMHNILWIIKSAIWGLIFSSKINKSLQRFMKIINFIQRFVQSFFLRFAINLDEIGKLYWKLKWTQEKLWIEREKKRIFNHNLKQCSIVRIIFHVHVGITKSQCRKETWEDYYKTEGDDIKTITMLNYYIFFLLGQRIRWILRWIPKEKIYVYSIFWILKRLLSTWIVSSEYSILRLPYIWNHWNW